MCSINIVRRGLVIRKVRKCWWWFSVPTGVRIIILFTTLTCLVEIIAGIYRISTSEKIHSDYSRGLDSEKRKWRRAKCNDSYMFLSMDIFCSVFDGYINIYSFFYFLVQVMTHSIMSIFGIIAWTRRFQLKITEKFFYSFFVVSMFFFIQTCILYSIQEQGIINIIASSFGRALYTFYVNSVLYSFILLTDTAYRRMRRKGGIGHLAVDQPNQYTRLYEDDNDN